MDLTKEHWIVFLAPREMRFGPVNIPDIDEAVIRDRAGHLFDDDSWAVEDGPLWVKVRLLGEAECLMMKVLFPEHFDGHGRVLPDIKKYQPHSTPIPVKDDL